MGVPLWLFLYAIRCLRPPNFNITITVHPPSRTSIHDIPSTRSLTGCLALVTPHLGIPHLILGGYTSVYRNTILSASRCWITDAHTMLCREWYDIHVLRCRARFCLFVWTTVGRCLSIPMVPMSGPLKLGCTISYSSNNSVYTALVSRTRPALHITPSTFRQENSAFKSWST